MVLLTSTPAPAPDTATLPLPDTLIAAATPVAVIDFVLTASSVMPPLCATTLAVSMAARPVPPITFSLSATATERLPATPPLLRETETEAAITSALICALSVRPMPTAPPAVTPLSETMASVLPRMVLFACASASAAASDTLPLVALTAMATPTEVASIWLLLVASTVTAPPVVITGVSSMPARTTLEISFVASAMAADMASDTVPDPAETEAVAATSVALIVLPLSASMSSAPPMLAMSAPKMPAVVDPPMVFCACATPKAPANDTVPDPMETATAAATCTASMALVESALIVTAPPASIPDETTCAATVFEMLLSARDTAADSVILAEPEPPRSAEIAAVTTVAVTLAASVAVMSSAPSTMASDAPRTPASTVLLMLLSALAPAPAPLSDTLPPPVLTPSEAATAVAVIDPSEEASSRIAPPVDRTSEPPSTTARVVFWMTFCASLTATVREADAPLPPPTETDAATATSVAEISVESTASSVTSPVAVTSALRIAARTELVVSL